MKNFRFILTLLLVVGVGYSASAQTAAEVKAKFNEAAAKYNAKDFTASIALFEATIALADKSSDDVLETLEASQGLLVDSYFKAGITAAKGGKFDEAAAILTKGSDLATLTSNSKARSIGTMLSNVYFAKGTGLAKAEKPAEAAIEFNNGYERDKRNTKLGLLAAEYFATAGNVEKSTAIYNEIIVLGEKHSKYAAAATAAKSAITSSFLSAAVDAIKANDYATVLSNVESILAVDPTSAQGLLVRIQAANNMKKTDDVIKFAPEAIAAQSDAVIKSNINFFLGAAYQTKEMNAKAIAAYKLVTAGDNVAAAKGLVTALIAQDK